MKIKSILTIIAVSLLVSPIYSQQYRSFAGKNAKESENSTVYYVPKTDIRVKFTVEKTVRTPGIYSDKAYLIGVDNSKLKNTTTYTIKSAEILTSVSPDTRTQYLLSADSKTIVEKTPSGLLKSVRAKALSNEKENKVNNNFTEPLPQPNITQQNLNTAAISLPTVPTYETRLLNQGLLTSYPQMSAEKTAEQIKKLRDKQIELLSGGWEGTYMNTTVDFMYKQLDEIINGYIALFVGTQTTVTEEYIYQVSPEKPIILEEDLLVPLCKFSQSEGFSEASSKNEGTKILVRIHSLQTTDENSKGNIDSYVSEQTKKKMDKEGVGIYYCMPEQVKVSLQIPQLGNVSKIVKLMQYGHVGFTSDHTLNLDFDAQSGELIRMW